MHYMRTSRALALWQAAWAQGRSYRRTARRTFIANVRALPLDGRHAPVGGISEDISPDGVFISSVSHPGHGALVLLRIYVQRTRLSLLARVVRCREGRGFGCQFVDLDQQTRWAMASLVAR